MTVHTITTQKSMPRKLTVGVLATVGVLLLCATKAFATEKVTPHAVDRVDLNKYAGQWYEIAHLPMYFQRKCASDTRATYSLKQNGKVQVLNQCHKTDGKVIQSVGEATAVDSSNSRLKVTFLPDGLKWLPFGKGDYWVLKLDESYQTALVGGPSHKYLWILSRTPQLDGTVLKAYLEEATRQGYDISKLVYTPHKQVIPAT